MRNWDPVSLLVTAIVVVVLVLLLIKVLEHV